MKNRAIYIFTLLVFIHINSCQYPVDLNELPDPQQFIVIDAELTESYASVRVTYTLAEVKANGSYNFPKPPNATAYVMDGKGNRQNFKIDGSRDSTFRGVVGETYKLYVMVNGKTYESTEETMRPCPEIDSLSAIYTREPKRIENDILYDGFDVYVNFTDFAAQENYYQWTWVHYDFQYDCDTREISGEGLVRIPCYPTCWSIEYNNNVIVQWDKLRDGNAIAHRLKRVPFGVPPYRYYYLSVQQRSITPRVYEYLKSIETQTQNVGSIFDIPAQTRFSPNIYNANDPNEQVLGVFNVFSSSKKIIQIDMRQEIPGVQLRFIGSLVPPFTIDPFITAPCIEGTNRTRVKPEGWID